jgi:ribonucleoside-diphosphate reductase alpha chain
MTSIIKRDGSTVPWEKERVFRAMRNAFLEVDGDLTTAAEEICLQGAERATNLASDPFRKEPISVERVQDFCEQHLIDSRRVDVARSFMSYRQRRAAERITADLSDELAEYVFRSKYSRRNPDGTLESWDECVERNRQMHLRHLSQRDSLREMSGVTQSLLTDAFPFVSKKLVLPSMRSMQFAGAAIEANHCRMFNCSFTVVNDFAVFSEAFYLLLCGPGVGYSVSQAHVKSLPPIPRQERPRRVRFYQVRDTIEGWAQAVAHLIRSYVEGSYPEFDYSLIRPEGSPLVTSGGSAPGHIPLKKSLEDVRKIFEGAQGRQLTTFECHRIMCFLALGVLSGGIRRSSLIALFDYDDVVMRRCKSNSSWFSEFPELSMANNSVILERKRLASYDLEPIINGLKTWGEPGIFISEHPFHGTNPCGEIGLFASYTDVPENGAELSPYGGRDGDEDQSAGFGFCNLTEVNCARIAEIADSLGENSPEGVSRFETLFLEAVRAASVLGTIQASYTEFNSLIGRGIAERDGLLGVSLTGLCDAYSFITPELLQKGARLAVATNAYVAPLVGVRPARRVTCIKPSGTASLVLGNVSSGIHPHHARTYFRRVTANRNEAVFKKFYEANPHMVRENLNGDFVITFPVRARKGAVVRSDFSARGMLEFVELVYKNWVVPGTVAGEITHNVSCTVSVRDSEWDLVLNELRQKFQEAELPFRSITLMGDTSDKKWVNAPREEVSTSEDILVFKSLVERFTPVDYSHASDGTFDIGSACEGPSCEI